MVGAALPGRIRQIREIIAARQAVGGWTHPVRIIAVTKTHPAEVVRAAVQAGLTAVGENRVQEALAKQDALPDLDVEWHLIGTLQRNKVRKVVGRFACIHSVDRESLITELGSRTPADRPQDVLVEVNCSGESQKGGADPAALPALLDAIAGQTTLRIRGLMTMAPLTEETEVQRGAFRRLRELRDAMTNRGWALPELSMGMSGDYPVAVEEGATMVRLGTLLFGERA